MKRPFFWRRLKMWQEGKNAEKMLLFVFQKNYASILCGRGMYKAKENEYLPQEVLNRIEKAIDKSNSKIFFMNAIF